MPVVREGSIPLTPIAVVYWMVVAVVFFGRSRIAARRSEPGADGRLALSGHINSYTQHEHGARNRALVARPRGIPRPCDH